MQFTDDEITIVPGHETSRWQSCNYFARGQELFHERTYFRRLPSRRDLTPASIFWLAGGNDHSEQWMRGGGSKSEIEALAAKHGGNALEEFYPPDDASEPMYFLAFSDTDKAIAFCRTEDFDRLCLTMDKV